MIPLAFGAAISGVHTRLARLETSASLSAALGAAADRRHQPLLPPPPSSYRTGDSTHSRKKQRELKT